MTRTEGSLTGRREPHKRLRRGPRPGAEPEDVLRVARRRFLALEPFDVSAIAAEAGVSRTTLWRWFGDRDALLGELLGGLAVATLQAIAARVRTRGTERFVTIVERFFGAVTTSEPLLRLLRADPVGTVGILMAPHGGVHDRLVDAVERQIERELGRGSYTAALPPRTLAELTVEIGMVHLWANVLAEGQPNIERAVEAIRALATLQRPPPQRAIS